jgi:IS5 family transposase
LITTIVPTVGHAADNEAFPRLLAHDEEIGVGATIYAGDKAYDDTDLHYRLWAAGKGSALRLKEDRTRVSNDHQAFWRQVAASRFKVERKYGEAKRWHGLGRCRYLGLWRYGIQAYLTALVLNLKRIVVLLRGVRFRAGSRRWQAVVA